MKSGKNITFFLSKVKTEVEIASSDISYASENSQNSSDVGAQNFLVSFLKLFSFLNWSSILSVCKFDFNLKVISNCVISKMM